MHEAARQRKKQLVYSLLQSIEAYTILLVRVTIQRTFEHTLVSTTALHREQQCPVDFPNFLDVTLTHLDHDITPPTMLFLHHFQNFTLKLNFHTVSSCKFFLPQWLIWFPVSTGIKILHFTCSKWHRLTLKLTKNKMIRIVISTEAAARDCAFSKINLYATMNVSTELLQWSSTTVCCSIYFSTMSSSVNASLMHTAVE